jgi:hypothetical protein
MYHWQPIHDGAAASVILDIQLLLDSLLMSLDRRTWTTSFVAYTIAQSNLWGHLKGTDYQK